MNTMGKILVILNLLFALAVGGFLVIDFGTRTNWKEAYDSINQELQVAKTNSDALINTNRIQNKKMEKMEQELTDLQKKYDVKDQDYKKESAKVMIVEAEKNTIQNLSLIERKQFVAQAQRLEQENKDLQKVISSDVELIGKLQEEKENIFQKMVQAENGQQTTQARNEFLLKELRELHKEMAKLKTSPLTGATGVAAVTDPGSPNPPAVNIETKVIEVGTSGDLVRLSVGSDAGLKKGHTLDIYRTQPTRQYLGMIRIVDVGPLESVGQRVATGPYASREPIRVSDWVISDVARTP